MRSAIDVSSAAIEERIDAHPISPDRRMVAQRNDART
jgi:hypothetical protein